MASAYLYIKALHIIFVVAWFAGLFYFPRLLIYHVEALEKKEEGKQLLIDQLKIMQQRLLFIITWPAAILTFFLGLTMLHYHVTMYGRLQFWMGWKLGFLVLLYGYHFWLHRIYKSFKKGDFRYNSMQLRFINEIATILLFAIIFLVTLKNSLNALYGVLGLIGLVIALMIGIKIYKKSRKG